MGPLFHLQRDFRDFPALVGEWCGAAKRLSYLEQNIAAASLHLSEDDIAKLDRAYAPGCFTGDRYTAEGMKGVNA